MQAASTICLCSGEEIYKVVLENFVAAQTDLFRNGDTVEAEHQPSSSLSSHIIISS